MPVISMNNHSIKPHPELLVPKPRLLSAKTSQKKDTAPMERNASSRTDLRSFESTWNTIDRTKQRRVMLSLRRGSVISDSVATSFTSTALLFLHLRLGHFLQELILSSTKLLKIQKTLNSFIPQLHESFVLFLMDNHFHLFVD